MNIASKSINTRLYLALLMSAGIFISSFTSAEEENLKEEEESSAWKANVEFGYVATSGNTKTTTVNSGFAAVYEIEYWRHSINLKSIFGSAENDTTSQVETNAERYFVEGKTDYKYSKESYAFLLVNYDDNRFSDNDYQTSLSAGRGFSFVPNEGAKFDMEVGVGYRETKKKVTLLLAEETIDETIFRLAANYTWEITENSKFEQKLSTEIGDENTVTKSYSGLSANVAKNMALKLSLTATHQSDVRPETENLDTVTAFTLVYNF